jgi:hypothetical protein
MIISIDPGSKKAGVALFETTGKLMTAWLSRGGDWRETADNIMADLPVNAARITEAAVERMQVYDSTPLAHANDCITLSLMAGYVAGRFSVWTGAENIHAYYPHQWKGQVPKKIMVERIKNKVTDSEKKRVKDAKAHDVWDAIGIGLYHLRKVRK